MVYRKAKSFRICTYKKHPGGTPNFPTCKRSNFANLSSNPYLVTSLPPYLVTSSVLPVPFQPDAPGATMSEGAGILHAPGKHLLSPRCLRLERGHREQLDDVPGHPGSVGVASRAWVQRSRVGPISRVARRSAADQKGRQCPIGLVPFLGAAMKPILSTSCKRARRRPSTGSSLTIMRRSITSSSACLAILPMPPMAPRKFF